MTKPNTIECNAMVRGRLANTRKGFLIPVGTLILVGWKTKWSKSTRIETCFLSYDRTIKEIREQAPTFLSLLTMMHLYSIQIRIQTIDHLRSFSMAVLHEN